MRKKKAVIIKEKTIFMEKIMLFKIMSARFITTGLPQKPDMQMLNIL